MFYILKHKSTIYLIILLCILMTSSCISGNAQKINATLEVTDNLQTATMVAEASQTPTIMLPTIMLTPTSTLVPTTTPSIIRTNPTPFTVTPTATPYPTDRPTSMPDYFSEWNLKIAFATFQEDNTSQVWVLETAEGPLRPLLRFEADNPLLSDQLSWSHSGDYIAYSHVQEGEYITVSVIDVDSLTTKTLGASFPLHPVGSGASAGLDISPYSWSKNDDWFLATFNYIHPETHVEFRQELIFSTKDNQVFELDETIEFVAWSPVKPEQFLYIKHPDIEGGEITIHIGQIGQNEPVNTISDLGHYAPGKEFHLSWSPDAAKAIATSFDGVTRNTNVIVLDFQEEQWRVLDYQPQGRANPSLWSPNGQWLVFLQSDGFYLWEINKEDSSLVQLNTLSNSVTFLMWFQDENRLLYQDGDILYAVKPEQVQMLLPILDLTILELVSERQIHMNTWASSRFP